MSFNLLVPIAADKPEYGCQSPYIFRSAGDGIAICIHSILGLNLNDFDRIYFTLLKKHDDEFSAGNLLKEQLGQLGLLDRTDIITLYHPTKSQAETIYETIRQTGMTGALMIKDGDSFFSADIPRGNGLCVFPLDALNLVNPQNKSYISVDNSFYVTNIKERRIISRFFNAGGYVFDSTQLFERHYLPLRGKNGLCLSHIIYSMLLDNIRFRAIECNQYRDWGTLADFMR